MDKIEKLCILIFTENICSACNPMQVVISFAKINFVEKRLKFYHFRGRIIPK